MKTSRKRVLAIAGFMLCLLLVLTAIGPGAAGAPAKVTIYYPGDPQKDEALVEEKLNEYVSGKIDAAIDLRPLDWGSVGDKLNLMLSSGEECDLIFNPSWMRFYMNVAAGAFLPLDDLLAKYGQGIKANIHPAFLLGPRVDGKLYAIPTNKELTQAKAFYFRKDIVEKYKFDLNKLTSFDKMEQELGPMFKTIKAKEPGLVSIWQSTTSDWDYDVFNRAGVERPIGGFDYGFVTKKNPYKIVNAIDLPLSEQLKPYKLLRKWYLAGYMNQDSATSQTRKEEAIEAGKLWTFKGLYKPNNEVEWFNNTGRKYQFLVKVIDKPYVTTGDTIGSQMAISRTSKHPDKAMQVLNLLHTDKYVINLVNFGLEGKHYKKVGENTIERIQNSGYNAEISWEIGNQFLTYLQVNEDPKKWEKFKEFNATAEVSPLMGFVFDAEPVKTELAAIENIRSEFRTLGTGSVDPEPVLKKRNAKLKAAGVDRVIAEAQKQLDAWVKATKK